MQIQVLFFGVLKEAFGGAGESVELPEGANVATLVRVFAEQSSNQQVPWSGLAVAVNREYADKSTVLHDGDEVALLPPVSGGSHAR